MSEPQQPIINAAFPHTDPALNAIEEESNSLLIQPEPTGRGKLTVFLGYSPGVGKTRSMLLAAQNYKANGIDVVIAYADTHGRPDITGLMDGIEFIPGKHVEHHGGIYATLDLDAILARRPKVVVVGDLAHTNIAKLRHLRRYQDVEELLEQGIDVFATLNIYNLESLNDTIYQLTNERIRETVPDRLVDLETEIELVDMPVSELLNRVQSGQFYISEQIAQLPRRFFRLESLLALRELCLRWAAHRADDQMQGHRHSQTNVTAWPTAEQVMVCISAHPLSERLVRTGRQMAEGLKAGWCVVNVEVPGRHYSAEQDERIAKTMRLANELGAQMWTIPGRTIPEALIRFAQEQHVTRLVVGRPIQSRMRALLKRSMVHEIIRLSESIDVYVVCDKNGS